MNVEITADWQDRRQTQPQELRSLWWRAGRRLLDNRPATAALVFLLLLAVAAILADQLAPFSYSAQDLNHPRVGPGVGGHWLGTDALGRDIFSRLLYGARVSLMVSGLVLLTSLVIGLVVGMLAGYYGGIVDQLFMRATDMIFAFPDLLFAILIMGIRGAGIENVMVALAVVAWPGLARLVRGQVLSLREADFVLAARSLGASDGRIALSHLLPSLLSPVLVNITMRSSGIILAEASLSFLGIGVKPPYPSWGAMVSELFPMVFSSPILLVPPCALLALTVLALNFLGDGVRDALDPRLH